MLGFDAARVTSPDAIAAAGGRFAAFLEAGRHGDMAWLATNAERRRNPARLWPEVRSIIMLGMSYAPETNPLDALDHPDAWRHFGLCAGQGLPRHHQRQAQAARSHFSRRRAAPTSRYSSIRRR